MSTTTQNSTVIRLRFRNHSRETRENNYMEIHWPDWAPIENIFWDKLLVFCHPKLYFSDDWLWIRLHKPVVMTNKDTARRPSGLSQSVSILLNSDYNVDSTVTSTCTYICASFIQFRSTLKQPYWINFADWFADWWHGIICYKIMYA